MSADPVLVWAFALAAAAGLSNRLRDAAPMSWRAAGTAILFSGMLGLAIALLWYAKFKDDLYFLVGLCVVSGLAGPAALNFVVDAVAKGGFAVKLGKNGSSSVAGLSVDRDD